MVSGNSVGIDYHSERVRVCVLSEDGKVLGDKDLENSVSAVCEFMGKFGAVSSVAVEASTGSANFADEVRQSKGYVAKLCHPGYVQRMRHNPDKSDKADSFLLADLNRVGYLPEVWLAPAWLRDARELVRYRRQLVDGQRNTKLRIRAQLRQNRQRAPKEFGLWTRKGWSWLQSQADALPVQTSWVFRHHLAELLRAEESIREVERHLKGVIGKEPLFQRLLEEPGLGFVSAATVYLEIGTFTRFKTGKQLSRYIGVTPRNASSGERQADSGLIKAGNPLLKTTLIEVAQVVRRIDPASRDLVERLRKAGKPGNVITAAVSNRWVRRLFYKMVAFETSLPLVAEAA